MRKIFTLFMAAMGFGALSTQAVNYLPAPTSTTPADNSVAIYLGDVMISWADYILSPNVEDYKTNDVGTAIQYTIEDGYKYVTLTVNGETIDLENDFFFALQVTNVKEQSGRTISNIVVQQPFAFFTSKGEFKLHIDEGIAVDTYGAVNPAYDLTFWAYDQQWGTLTWNPASGTSFDQGTNPTITASWSGATIKEINRIVAAEPIFLIKSGDDSNHIGITNYCVIENNQLNIQVPPLAPGSYELFLTDGAILFDDNTVNIETSYGFTITGNPDLVFPTATVTPTIGAKLETLEGADKIIVTWDGSTIYLNDSETPLEVFVNEYAQTGFEVYLTENGERVTEGNAGTALVIDLSALNVQGGVYSAIIPAGYVSVTSTNGEATQWSEEITPNYTVLVAPTPTVFPLSGREFKTTDNIGTVSISWPGCYFNVNESLSPSLTLNGTPVNYTLTPEFEWTMDSGADEEGNAGLEEEYVGNQINFDLSGLELEAGEYQLILPAGYVELAGLFGEGVTVDNPQVEITYNVMSIYMDQARVANSNVSFGDPNASVELVWPSAVSIDDPDNLKIPVLFNGEEVGQLTADYLNIVADEESVPSTSTRADAYDRGEIMYLLLGAAELLDEVGTYEIELPANAFINAIGQYSQAQTIVVNVTTLAVGEIQPVSGATFVEGEEVAFTVTFADVMELLPNSVSENAPLVVYAATGNDYDETFNWSDSSVLTISGNVININLGTELEVGTYYLSLREGAVVADGNENASIDDYAFEVKADTSGIENIGLDLNGDVKVYNLQGVQVNPNNLGRGLYIINGKKVLVR